MAASSIPNELSFTVLRPLHAPAVSPVLGMTAGLALARTDLLPWPEALAGLALLSLGLVACGRRRSAAAVLAGFVLGLGSLLTDARRVLVDDSWVHGVQTVQATVVDVRRSGTAVRLRLDHLLRQDGGMLPGRVDVYVHGHAARFRQGARIELRARFHRPSNRRNPGAFDYRAWCFDHHLALIGSAVGVPVQLRAGEGVLPRWRERVRQAIDGAPASGVLSALLLADRSGIDEASWLAFSATGTAHLLAISGMHLGMVGALGLAIAWWLLTRREAWIVRLPVRALAWSAALALAVAYAALAGWPLPARRAAMMMGAGVLAWWWSARVSPIQVLALALAAVLAFDPAAIASASLWLSFLATAAIVVFAPRGRAHRWWQRLALLASVSLLAWLATLPIVADMFGRLPVWSLPANLALVPWFGGWVLPWALLGELLAIVGWLQGAHMAMEVAGLGIEWGMKLLQTMQGLPLGDLVLGPIPAWAHGCYVVAMAAAGWAALCARRRKALLLAALGVAVFAAAALRPLSSTDLRWIVWDVGQGAASSVVMPDGAVLTVDVPGRAGSRFNGGVSVAEGLRALGFTHLDALLISHAQRDHAGGALSLVRRMRRVGELWLPLHAREAAITQPLLQWAERQGVPVRWLKRGQRFLWHGAEISVLWAGSAGTHPVRNRDSLVVRIRWPEGPALLFPGDIERATEARLVADLLPVWGMLMPHHGSRTSSSTPFVHALRPRLAVAQVGQRNRYGFPAPEVVRRYRAIGCRVVRTAEGAVLVRWRHGVAEPEARQWHDAFSPRRRLALQWAGSLL